MQAANVKPTIKPSRVIEDFDGEWRKEWFSENPDRWQYITNKIGSEPFQANDAAVIAFETRADESNELVVRFGDYASVVDVSGGNQWQVVELSPSDLQNLKGESLMSFNEQIQIKFSPAEWLTPTRGDDTPRKRLGKNWKGPEPKFRNLHWK